MRAESTGIPRVARDMIEFTPLLVVTLAVIVGLFAWLALLMLRPPRNTAERPRATPMMVIATLVPAGMFGVILACVVFFVLAPVPLAALISYCRAW